MRSDWGQPFRNRVYNPTVVRVYVCMYIAPPLCMYGCMSIQPLQFIRIIPSLCMYVCMYVCMLMHTLQSTRTIQTPIQNYTTMIPTALCLAGCFRVQQNGASARFSQYWKMCLICLTTPAPYKFCMRMLSSDKLPILGSRGQKVLCHVHWHGKALPCDLNARITAADWVCMRRLQVFALKVRCARRYSDGIMNLILWCRESDSLLHSITLLSAGTLL